jgi:ADP-heptose:LPS heptosyltransferase
VPAPGLAMIEESRKGLEGPYAVPKPAMVGRYLFRNPVMVAGMSVVDALLALVPRRASLPARVDSMLLANWGHLGDVVTTFGVIAALRQRHPNARIGMIAASWGAAALREAGLVDKIHLIDHWALNRGAIPKQAKRARFRETLASALPDIRAARYQIGIDLYPFFPPAHPVFYRAGIPLRAGYTSSGFGGLLTHPVRWGNESRPMGDQYRDLLNRVWHDAPFAEGATQPRRAPDATVALPEALAIAGPYIVLHPGAGAVFKDWGLENWRALLSGVSERFPGHRVVLTGAGAGEVGFAAELYSQFPAAINLAGAVDWAGYVSVLAHADLVICPDTAAGHVAALFNKPVISIFTGVNNAEQWRPYTHRGSVLTHPVACAPCYRAGCEAMACVRKVPSGLVLSQADAFLAEAG